MFTSVFPSTLFSPREISMLARVLDRISARTLPRHERDKSAETVLSLYASGVARTEHSLLLALRDDLQQIAGKTS
jgi:hypothetical protein